MTEYQHHFSDLESRIVPIDHIPALAGHGTEATVRIDITGDRELSGPQQTLLVEPDTLALNGLLLLYGKPATGAEIRDAGGAALFGAMLTKRIQRLNQTLKAVTGLDTDMVMTMGPPNHNRRFQLSPEIAFSDKRLPEDAFAQFGITGMVEEEGILRAVFKTSQGRRELLEIIFSKYAQDEYVLLVGAQVVKSHADLKQNQKDIELSPQELTAHFELIEHAIVAYIDGDNSYEAIMLLKEATIAYQHLILSVLPTIRRLIAAHARYPAQARKEAFQYAAINIAKAIMDHGQQGGLAKKSEYFYKKCNVVAHHAILKSLASEINADNQRMPAEGKVRQPLIEQQERLRHELKREPSVEEIAAELGLDEEIVRRHLFQKRSLPLDTLTDEGAAYYGRAGDLFDEALDAIERERIIANIFNSKLIKLNEKVAMSLQYGVFVKSLCGAEIYNRRTFATFVYPYTESDFDEMLKNSGGFMREVGEIIGYTKAGVRLLLKKGEEAARRHILDED